MSAWSSDLYVFGNDAGQEYISVAPPTGVDAVVSWVKRYRAFGPYILVEKTVSIAVSDAATWINDKQAEGFIFDTIDESDFSKHYSDESFWDKVTNFAKQAGREVVEKSLILYYVGNDPTTPLWAKGVAGAALGYFIFPVDAIPDFMPFVGYADDLGAIVSALAAIATCITLEHRDKAKRKTDEWFGKR